MHVENSKEKNINKKAIKSGLWYSVGNLLTKGISLITAPIFIRILSKQELGEFNTFNSWLSILVIILSLDLASSYYRAKYDFEDHMGYIKSNLIMTYIWSVVFLILGFSFRSRLLKYMYINEYQIVLVGIYLMLQNGYNFFLAENSSEFKYKRVSLLSFIYSFSTALLSIGGCFYLENKFNARVYGLLMPAIIIGLLINGNYLRKKAKISAGYCKYALSFSIPLVFHSLGGVILNSSDKIMITYLCGSEDTAIYSVSYTVISIVTIFTLAVNQAFVPWLFAKLKDNKLVEVKAFVNTYIFLFLICFFVVILLGPEVLMILAGSRYSEAIDIYIPLIASTAILFVYYFYINVEQYSNDTKWIPVCTGIAALVNIVTNMIFIPLFGYQAAAYTTLFGYIVMQIMHVLYCVFKYKFDIIGAPKVVGVDVICILLSICGNVLYEFTYVRYSICILLVLFGICILPKKIKKLY